MDIGYTVEQPPLDRTSPVDSVRVKDRRVHVRQNGYCYRSPEFSTHWFAEQEANSFLVKA